VRIVGGQFKGRSLVGPRSNAIRPTSDRLRESLFNVLTHAYEDACAGARVIDLFSGTGALALEALSRGASFAVMVDEGAEARGLLRANVEACGVAGITRVMKRDATKLGLVTPFEPFTLLFCDPPYRKGLSERALLSARSGGWLVSGALVVVEEAADTEVALPEGFEVLERREAGESQIIIARG
jgi:16S rRNA (guanine966-N2)-methyltransferase